MKKIAIVVAILALTAPVMAAVTINAVPIGTTGDVNITYVADVNISGFGLDITVDSGANITAINNFHIGESNSTATGFGIFPGSIDINSVTAAVDDYGNPVAPNDDPCALGGIGTAGITIELGALYEDGYQPGLTGTLCTVTVSADCNITVALNARRGGVVREDFGDANTNLPITVPVTVVSLCTVPNILGMTQYDANTAIIAAGLSVGTIDWDTSTVVDIDTVMSQDPNGGTEVSCNPTAVNYNLSSGCYPKCKSDYSTWRSIAGGNFLTHSWCWPRQCYGELNNATEVVSKVTFWIGYADLNVFLAQWLTQNSTADINHATEVVSKVTFRVGYADLNIFLANWLSNPVGDCQNCP